MRVQPILRARIHSRGKGDFLYGRFEARAKVPRGKGTWPAIWMLPSDPFRYATTCHGRR
jgi:beta-glucanase (GH16 family)